MREPPALQRIARRDLPWTGAWVAALCGPFDMPTRDDLERAVVALDERYPHSRLAWGWCGDRRRWAPGPGSPTDLDIVTDGGPESADLGQMLDDIAGEQTLRTPLALIRYENYLGLRMSHAIGDGRTFNEVFAAVLSTAITGEVSPWRIAPSSRFPLGRAIFRTFARDPRLLRAVLADKPARSVPAAGERAPWSPARRTLTAVISAADKKDFIDAAAGSSWLAVLIGTVLRSLQAEGVVVAPDISVVVDLRRYLSDRSLDGNFVIGVPLKVDHRHGPEAISAALKATVASGRPLATQVLAALSPPRAGVHGPTSVDTSTPVRVTFSAMGQPPQIDSLPFRPGGPAMYFGGVEPEGPHGLTFLVSETSRTTVVSASFHANVVPPAAVQAALSAIACRAGVPAPVQAVT